MSCPRSLRLIARVLLPAADREFIIGDLEELYLKRAREHGVALAAFHYLREVIASVASRSVPGRGPVPKGIRPRRGPRASLDGLFSDVRQAFRSLRRQPVFVLIVALTLGVGVGSAGAIFGIVNQLLLRPVPGVVDQSEVAFLEFRTPDRRALSMSWPDVDDLRGSSNLLDGFAAFRSTHFLPSTEGARPVDARGYYVYGDYFELLGVRPVVGRLLLGDEAGPNADPNNAVISETLWTSLFNRDPDVVGRQLEAGGHSLTVLGVAGDGFRGTDRFWEVDIWVPSSALGPLENYPTDRFRSREARRLQFFLVRRSSGVGLQAAEDQVNLVLRSLAAANPGSYLADARATLSRGLMNPQIGEFMTAALGVLGAIVVLVLLIPCANVANLLLVRSAYRRGDMAVRRAMGASVGRIAREQVAESLILAGLGTFMGLGIARVIGMSYRGQSLMGLPGLEGFVLDKTALVFASVAVVVTTLLFGVVPALLAGRFNLSVSLRSATTQATGRHGRLRQRMSTIQIALSLPLLVSGILLGRTLQHINGLELGLAPEGVYVSTLQMSNLRPDDVTFDAMQRQLVDAVQEVPGVEAAAIAGYGPYAMARPRGRIGLPNRPDDDLLIADIRWASPGWLELLEMDVVAGRTFGSADWSMSGPPRVILSAPLARRLFGRVDVAGRTVRVGLRDLMEAEIVGVFGDARVADPRAPPDELFVFGYAPQYLRSAVTLHVRTAAADAGVLDGVRAAMESAVPELPIPQLAPLTQRIDVQLAEQRIFARLLGLLSSLAILVAAVGLYGLVAFMVANRRREFGIRIALGADGRRIAALALRSLASSVGSGTILGLMGAYGLSRLIENRLVGVEAVDAASYLGAIATLVVVSAIACWAPAAAAARLDPTATLRME